MTKKTYQKLLRLTVEEANLLRRNGIEVPFRDYDSNKEDFSKYLVAWSPSKKVAFLKKLMADLGMSIAKEENQYEFKIDHEREDMVKTLNYLSCKDNLVEVRKPEVIEDKVPTQLVTEKVS